MYGHTCFFSGGSLGISTLFIIELHRRIILNDFTCKPNQCKFPLLKVFAIKMMIHLIKKSVNMYFKKFQDMFSTCALCKLHVHDR